MGIPCAQGEFKVIPGGITSATGYRASGVFAGIRRKKNDVALIVSDVPASAAGVYTTNKVKAAPILICMDHVGTGTIQAIAVISGNANACTGEQGYRDALAMTEIVGRELGIDPKAVAPSSTGVIGVPLPMEKVEAGLVLAAKSLSTEGGWDAAVAIMTTDTATKECAVEFSVGGKTARMGGMAKGSGMIHPNMATMLAFITTDAAVEPSLLHKALKHANEKTFNSITVDGDTSTNDMVLVMANGLAGNPVIAHEGEDYQTLVAALTHVCQDLAMKIVRDGEGASKFIEIHVTGAGSEADARAIAMSIAKSSLVKTAVFGNDANWGRILCAAGYSGVDFDPSKVDIFIGPVKVAEFGGSIPFDEDEARKVLSERDVYILLDLKAGSAEAKVWTCDLTYDYIKINASYRT